MPVKRGNFYGRWLVLHRSHTVDRKWYWLCSCECGRQQKVRGDGLTSGRSTSCGCYVNELNGARLSKMETTHGHTKGKTMSPTFQSWRGMRERCLNPKHGAWPYYGGRGITFCERWKKFENFLSDMGDRPEGMTLDRRDTDGNYEPGNCRWADRATQTSNRRKRGLRWAIPAVVPSLGRASPSASSG